MHTDSRFFDHPFLSCGDQKNHEQIFGLTIDDVWYDDIELEDVTEEAENLDCQTDGKDSDVRRDKAGGLCGNVPGRRETCGRDMACPVDSFIMNNYEDEESYLKRFKDSYEYLSQ